jgi:hypothetical protein
MTHKQQPTCPTCGGYNIYADANASWDFENQQWALANTYEPSGYCNDCEDGHNIVWIDVQEPSS